MARETDAFHHLQLEVIGAASDQYNAATQLQVFRRDVVRSGRQLHHSVPLGMQLDRFLPRSTALFSHRDRVPPRRYCDL